MGRVPKAPIQKYNESLSKDQLEAKKVIKSNVITCLAGRAGTGKTRLASTYALEQYALGRKNSGIKNIIITRPPVFKKEHNIGFLPGDIVQKLDPWLAPIIEIITDIEGCENYDKLVKDKVLKIVPTMFVQGRTFNNSIVIVDEAQNLNKEDTIAFFTRLGRSSQMIFCGDIDQALINKEESGFKRLCELSQIVEGVGYYSLKTNWRHPIIDELLKNY
jgi:phosphate starvation-inducible PhoH-like protein